MCEFRCNLTFGVSAERPPPGSWRRRDKALQVLKHRQLGLFAELVARSYTGPRYAQSRRQEYATSGSIWASLVCSSCVLAECYPNAQPMRCVGRAPDPEDAVSEKQSILHESENYSRRSLLGAGMAAGAAPLTERSDAVAQRLAESLE